MDTTMNIQRVVASNPARFHHISATELFTSLIRGTVPSYALALAKASEAKHY